jgi:hypothetical protein
MKIKKIREELKSLKDDFPWCENAGDIEIYVISSKGLFERIYKYTSLIIGPFVLSLRDFNGLSDKNSMYKPQDYEWSPDEVVEMFNAGCKPEIKYYKWGEGFEDEMYHELDELIYTFSDNLIEYHEPLSWDEMEDEDLADWYDILNYAKKGYICRGVKS